MNDRRESVNAHAGPLLVDALVVARALDIDMSRGDAAAALAVERLTQKHGLPCVGCLRPRKFYLPAVVRWIEAQCAASEGQAEAVTE